MGDSVTGIPPSSPRPVTAPQNDSSPLSSAAALLPSTAGVTTSVRDFFDRARNRATEGINTVTGLRDRLIERPFTNGRDGFVAIDGGGNILGGVAPGARIRDRDVPNFFNVDNVAEILADAEPRDVTFTLPGGRVLKGRTDEKGFKGLPLGELKGIAQGLDSKRGGLANIGISTPNGTPGSASVMALPKDYDGPIFISDIDDTLRHTQLGDVVTGQRQAPIPGAKQVLSAVAGQGVPIVYLSVGPDRIRSVNEDFLSQLPPGILMDRSEISLRDADPRNPEQARLQGYHKQQVIAQLRQTYPNAKLYGFGDDKYGDAMAYTRQGVTQYIHDVRPGNDNLPADFTGTMVRDYDPAFIAKVAADMKAAVAQSASFGGTPVPQDAGAALSRKLDFLTGTRVSEGNKIDLLVDGPAALPAILEGIDSAKESVFYETFEFIPNDPVANQVADHLIAAHKRGVKVRVVADAIGSHELPLMPNKTIDRMQAAGIDVKIYNPIDTVSDLTDFSRDHRKAVVVDGETAFVGGMNTGVEYMGPRTTHDWRHDLFTRIQGPAVAEVAANFADSWKEAGGDVIPPAELAGDHVIHPDGVKMRVVSHVPDEDVNIRAAYLAMIDSAQSHVNVENSFPMTPDLVDSLCAAAQRGVRVRYIVGNDEHLFGMVGRKNYQRMLDAGVEIYQYPTRVHTKALSVDGRVATVGSSNVDNVALDRNREIVALVEDPAWVKDFESRVFDRDVRGTPDGKRSYKFPSQLNDSVMTRIRNNAIATIWPDTFE